MGDFKLYCLIGLLCLGVSVYGATFDQVKGQVKLDLKWIDDKSDDQVDIIFVMDKSGSVGRNFPKAKQFVRTFLDYFSVAAQHAQVGIILFGDTVSSPIKLRSDDDKCNLMKELAKVPEITGGGTNAAGGLAMAINTLRYNSRRNLKVLEVVVFITDGYWNTGGDPIGQVNTLKNEGVILITIGIGRTDPKMRQWASIDVYKNPLDFHVDSFNQFAELAHYIHRGTHNSKYLTINNAECANRCKGGSTCMCDSLGRGAATCGCDAEGFYVNAANGCTQCPKGQYQGPKNIKRECLKCPKGQTTDIVGAGSKTSCLCQVGFWNRLDHKSRKPLNGICDPVVCVRDQPQTLNRHNIQVLGTCSYQYNQKCNYKCNNGYITNGQTTSVCQQSGLMYPPTVACTPLLCPALNKVDNSQGWKCETKGQPQTGLQFPYRTECRNRCNAGYVPRSQTNEYIYCGLDSQRQKGKWSGSTLVCDARKCPTLPPVFNGQYSHPECSNTNLDGRSFGTKCTVQCNHGFQADKTVEWTCGKDGIWSNEDQEVLCTDVRAPEFLACPQHTVLDNKENEGYATVTLKPLKTFDNDKASSIRQTMKITMAGTNKTTLYYCTDTKCGQEQFNFLVGRSRVNFTATDRSRNSRFCTYEIEVRDTEAPKVVHCDGPKNVDAQGFIYSDKSKADVTWDTPQFVDNSGKAPKVYSTSTPGEFDVGRKWTITYTAKDDAGNTAQCEFSFSLTGLKCPQLHRPANGGISCEKLSFGVYCIPQCQFGLDRLLPVNINKAPDDYFCTLKGKWLPHDHVGDCVLKVDVTDAVKPLYEFKWYNGSCTDEDAQDQIISNTLNALNSGGPSIRGQGFLASLDRPLVKDDFQVFCGPQNVSIVQISNVGARGRGGRARRSVIGQPITLP